MKFAFPTIKLGLYPVRPSQVFDADARLRLFAWGQAAGFDGIELEEAKFGLTTMSDAELDAVRHQLGEARLEPAAVKTGGDLYTPGIAAGNEQAMLDGVRVAAAIGSRIVSISLGTPAARFGVEPHDRLGGRLRAGGSALASDDALATTAAALRRVAAAAGDAGVGISLEIAPGSIADNSASALRLLNLVDCPALGLNPDLGNLISSYMEPEEDWRDCLVSMAPHTNHLHVKNVYGMRIPELQRTVFKRGALWDGVIDLRFVFAHLKQTGYEAYCVIEAAGSGDMLFNFEQGLDYARRLMRDDDTGKGSGMTVRTRSI